MQIKFYSINKLLKLINMQINIIKKYFTSYKKNLYIYIIKLFSLNILFIKN